MEGPKVIEDYILLLSINYPVSVPTVVVGSLSKHLQTLVEENCNMDKMKNTFDNISTHLLKNKCNIIRIVF